MAITLIFNDIQFGRWEKKATGSYLTENKTAFKTSPAILVS